MSVDIRNKKARDFITAKLDRASQLSDSHFRKLASHDEVQRILKDLIRVKAMGFRGVVATALTGQHLDPSYNPLTNFYGCNPRSIFEQGIFYAFQNRIPCGKSDPLNVAKNTNVLDAEWARGKRPASAANAAVDFLQHLENANEVDSEYIIDFFFHQLVKFSDEIKSIKIVVPPVNGIANQEFASKCAQFILEYPESGTIPQYVISRLLSKLYEPSCFDLIGGEESVFGTNTTSKKPADIWIEYEGKPLNLFEITVKKIDFKRLDDCIDALDKQGFLELPIQFICRLPTDITSLKGVSNSTLTYNGKVFNFVDIAQFTHSITALLLPEQIDALMAEISSFVAVIERPEKTKNGWNKIFSN
ncbi:MAG: hypothetical protein L3J65_08755 [Robiginitomaculum sp.]|nr:hypothetical protein [Robiginitomaculum sp.]